jgi:hypothetical protein
MNFPGLPAISGMVKVGADEFLVIHDTKSPLEPRLGVIYVRKDGPKYQEVGISNWPTNEEPPNDLEGICRISETSSEYLIAESGYYPNGDHFGRVIKIRYPVGISRHAEYLGSFRPFAPPPNNAETPRPGQIEGIAVVIHETITVLLLALRGGKEKSNEKKENSDKKVIPGQLIWGTLTEIEVPNPTFKKIGSHALTYDPIADRGAADLYIKKSGRNTWGVYSVATSDPDDLGPFRSAVYLAGTLTINVPNVCFAAQNTEKIVHWDFEGLKVEAIAEPADIFRNTSGLSIATDDELYSGIWRPVAKGEEPVAPSPLLFVKNAEVGFALK